MPDLRYRELSAADRFLLTQLWAVDDSGVSKYLTGAQLAAAWDGDYLGGTSNAAAAHETAVVTLEYPPGSGIAATRKKLQIHVFVPSYGGTPDPTGDIASIRFNGDSGTNYWSHHATYISGAWTPTETPSATLIRIAPTNSRLSRNAVLEVNNFATRSKTATFKNQTGTADATVVGILNVGGAEWVNIVDQISTVQLINAGDNNMGAGAGFYVTGKDF
jgi:hypothetical protein